MGQSAASGHAWLFRVVVVLASSGGCAAHTGAGGAAPATSEPAAHPSSSSSSAATQPPAPELAGTARGDSVSAEPLHPWLGIGLVEQPKDEPGVRVASVYPDSPAARAGVAPGDVLLLFDGHPINQTHELQERVMAAEADTDVQLSLVRDQAFRRLTVRLSPFPGQTGMIRKRLVGKPAPAWQDLSQVHNGAPAELEPGKLTVMVFWSTACGDCSQTIQVSNRWHRDYGPRGLRVVGVSVEGRELSQHAAKSFGIRYPILLDATAAVSRAYAASELPVVVLIDQQGIVRDWRGVAQDHMSQTVRPIELESTEALIEELL